MFDRTKLKKYIENNGIKQKHIAEKSGLTERALSLILTGKRKCDVEEYVSICIAINVPMGTFITQQVS